MKMADGGFRPAYNVQIESDPEAQIVVALELAGVAAADPVLSAGAAPNVRYYSLGATGAGPYQNTGTPGADGMLEAALDIALVDYLGGIAEGRLIRGDNPVLMTMELVLEVL